MAKLTELGSPCFSIQYGSNLDLPEYAVPCETSCPKDDFHWSVLWQIPEAAVARTYTLEDLWEGDYWNSTMFKSRVATRVAMFNNENVDESIVEKAVTDLETARLSFGMPRFYTLAAQSNPAKRAEKPTLKAQLPPLQDLITSDSVSAYDITRKKLYTLVDGEPKGNTNAQAPKKRSDSTETSWRARPACDAQKKSRENGWQ